MFLIGFNQTVLVLHFVLITSCNEYIRIHLSSDEVGYQPQGLNFVAK